MLIAIIVTALRQEDNSPKDWRMKRDIYNIIVNTILKNVKKNRKGVGIKVIFDTPHG